MSKYQRTKRDANHSEIQAYLEANGVWTFDASSVGNIVDLIICKIETAFLELKIEGSKACYTRPQIRFMSQCPAPVGIAKTKESALEFARDPRRFGLTQQQKDKLGAFLQFNPARKFQVSVIEGVINE